MKKQNKLYSAIFTVLGFICVTLGSIGIFIPILPTTPFLLLASWLFFKSNPKMREWLINHKILGVYIKNYIEDRKMPLKAKITTILLMWVTIIASATLFVENIHIKIFLLVVAVAVTVHLLLLGRKN